ALVPEDHEAVASFLEEHGFALMSGVFDEASLVAIEQECGRIQHEVARGQHPSRHGGEIFIDDDVDAAGGAGTPFVNYVSHVTELSPLAHAAATNPDVVSVM